MSDTATTARPAEPIAARARPGAPLDPAALTSGAVAAADPGGPGEGPTAGPVDPPDTGGGAPAPTPSPGGTGGGSGGATSPPGGSGGSSGGGSPSGGGDDAFAATAGASFLDLLKNAVSPDALEAQNIILRRIALQGDVIPSRVPAPLNITQIGGYLNLLTELGELDMRSQVLAGILGVAGPNPPLGWVSTSTPLSFSPLVNDRPAGPTQASLPVTVPVRSDLAGPLRSAQQALHDRGCVLPLLSGPLALPPAGVSTTASLDPMDYVGRTLRIAAAYALSAPATDPVALVRAAGTTDPLQIAVRSLSTGSVAVTPADYDALQLSGGAVTTVAISAAPMVMVAPILASAGFAPPSPLPTPTAAVPDAWAKLTATGGLVTGVTRLGDELRLLHGATEIAASAFSGMTGWTWTGTAFAP